MMNAEVTVENNFIRFVPHTIRTPHKDHGSVQVLAVLLDEVLVILVRFPLVLIIKLRTGNHNFTQMDGKYGAEAQSNVSPILKRINFIDATRTQGEYSHLGLLFILKSRIILVHGEEWRGKKEGGGAQPIRNWVSWYQRRAGRTLLEEQRAPKKNVLSSGRTGG